MRSYIRKRIIFFSEVIILTIIVFLFIKKESITVSSFTIATTSDLDKSVDIKVIQDNQKELYKQGIYNPLYTFVGELTGYAGDCPLCSGYLACPPRTNVLEKGIYYEDSTYGKIRIVASSRNYPCGTILKFDVSKLSDEPIIAIVLDRGVGGNNIDLLTESEGYAAKKVGRVRNLEFEVLREGWSR